MQKAEDNKAAVAGGIAGGVVFLAILTKCWHKMKLTGEPAAPQWPAQDEVLQWPEPQATAVQLELAKSAGSVGSTM